MLLFSYIVYNYWYFFLGYGMQFVADSEVEMKTHVPLSNIFITAPLDK